MSLFFPQREKIREKFVAALKKEFDGKGLRFTRGERFNTSKSEAITKTRTHPKGVCYVVSNFMHKNIYCILQKNETLNSPLS